MGDRYLPPRFHRDERPRYGRDNDHDPYGRYDRDERYSRHDRYDARETFRSPPPRSPPRLPRGRYDGGEEAYTFRGAAARHDDCAPPDQFSFRANGPRFPSPDRYPPPPRAPQRNRRGDNSRRGDHRRGPHGQQHGRPRWRPPPPASREILHETGRARTPEQLEGMNPDGQVRFNALASSSEEPDDEHVGGPAISSEEEGEIRRKRFKVDAPPPPNSDKPKWSNPDPYSALPPTETIGGPKKDIVQVIRKAKNDIAPKRDASQAVTKNADFISFTFDDDFDDENASLGQADAMDNNYLDASLSEAATTATVDRHGVRGDEVPSFPLKRSAPVDHGSSARLQPIDLMSDDEKEPPRKRLNISDSTRFTRQTPIDLTGDDDGPPPPPEGFVMPTDDELMRQYIGQPRGKKRKLDEQTRGKGDITHAWAANWTNSTPWCTIDRSQVGDVGIRLHEEISDFFDFVRPHEHEEALRQDIIQRVQASVRGIGGAGARDVEIKCFGSFAAGLYLPTADMDLVAVSRPFMSYGQRTFCQTGGKMHKLNAHMIRSGIAQIGTESAVTRAKVPIIKFTDRKTGIKVDISFENDSGLMANATFRQWKTQYPVMPVIVVLIKQLLAMRDLNEVFTGGLGGFSIICLVVSMLQHLTQEDYDNMVRNEDYGALLLKFLDLYGNQFDIHSTGIIMNPPGYYDKVKNPMRSQNANNLTIIDPNNQNNDISGGSREVHAVFEVFRKAHSSLLQRMAKIHTGKDVGGSILGCILGGNYTSFIQQRNRLYSLHSGSNVSSPPPPPPRANQPPPQKRKRHNEGIQAPSGSDLPKSNGSTRPPPGASLAARVQGGPPQKSQGGHPSTLSTQHDSQRSAAAGRRLKQPASQAGFSGASSRSAKRSEALKDIYPDLAHEIPDRLSAQKAKKMGLSKRKKKGKSKTGNGMH